MEPVLPTLTWVLDPNYAWEFENGAMYSMDLYDEPTQRYFYTMHNGPSSIELFEGDPRVRPVRPSECPIPATERLQEHTTFVATFKDQLSLDVFLINCLLADQWADEYWRVCDVG